MSIQIYLNAEDAREARFAASTKYDAIFPAFADAEVNYYKAQQFYNSLYDEDTLYNFWTRPSAGQKYIEAEEKYCMLKRLFIIASEELKSANAAYDNAVKAFDDLNLYAETVF